MAIYSIRDLEKLTGIKAHTIRIWEQRYKLLEPARTETNIRYYTDENLKHLFNIALLNRNGFKISKLAKMQPEEVAMRVAEISESNSSQNAQIDALTLAMIDLDEITFDRLFSTFTQEHGFEKAMLELIYPFLDKLNVLWLTNSISPAHEKFISNLIRRKLMCAIDQESHDAPSKDAPTFLLYLPEGEMQELTLLFMHYLLRRRGHKVIYLGSNTTLTDLRDANDPLHPQYVFSILQEPLSKQSVQSYIEDASAAVLGSQLMLTGAQLFVSPLDIPNNVKVMNGLPDTLAFLDSLRLKGKR
jgi:DNA-binding transcriptional MerR regulator